MRKILICLGLMACTPGSFAQQPSQDTPQSEQEASASQNDSFTKFEYQGFVFAIPASVRMNETSKEAIGKCEDGTFGMSIKVEKDKAASGNAAVEMCRRMVTELSVADARVTKLLVHGMVGAKMEGNVEGSPLTMLILAADGKFVKVVIINTPQRADWVNLVLDSVTRK
jgi:hypothetical protein